MEIDEAIRQSDDLRLKTKYNNAINVITRALALDSVEEVAFSFNGGKDSTVLLHLLRAGYYLHHSEYLQCNGIVSTSEVAFPIRIIYFESTSAFPEINSFTYEAAERYGLQMEIIRLDFKSGLEALLKTKPIRAIFLGVRIGDPTAVGQDQFSPSSPGWPPFMRVNPILDWSYRDVWAFLLTCKVQYCSLYNHGYTSIGSIHDTVPNCLLSTGESLGSHGKFKPAYLLADGRLERAGRARKFSSLDCEQLSSASNGLKGGEMNQISMLTASIIGVGDEMLFGTVEDKLGSSLCQKLHSIGWTVSHLAVTRSDIDTVADEIEKRRSSNDLVFLYGGLGPLHSDVTVAGVAKAFGVRRLIILIDLLLYHHHFLLSSCLQLAPDEEFEEYLRHHIGEKCTGDRDGMALLPEGITELLHHEKLPWPLIKCHNVICLTATNVAELDLQWNCLIELSSSNSLLVLLKPFKSKQLSTNLLDLEVAQPLSKLGLEFPDLYIGAYRPSRNGSLVVSFHGKEEERLEAAAYTLCKKFDAGAFSVVQ